MCMELSFLALGYIVLPSPSSLVLVVVSRPVTMTTARRPSRLARRTDSLSHLYSSLAVPDRSGSTHGEQTSLAQQSKR